MNIHSKKHNKLQRDIRRWWQYEDPFAERPNQALVYRDDSDYKVVIAGRRWGKTVLGCCWAINIARKSDEGLVWIMGQTAREVKKYYLKPIKERLRYLGFNVDEDPNHEIDVKFKMGNDPVIELKNIHGNWSTIELKSYNNEAALVGSGLDGLLMDEFRYMRDPDTFNEQLFPSLTDRDGKLLIISTPHGRDYLFNLYMMGQDVKNNPLYNSDWKSWVFDSYDNVYIKDKIDKMRKTMPPALFRQEYLCDFNVTSDTVYVEYNYEIHGVKNIQIDYSLPLLLSFDFNRKLMTTTVSQIRDGVKEAYINEHGIKIKEQDKVINVIKSINTTNTWTKQQCEEIHRWLREIKWTGDIILYGDASGHHQSSQSEDTNWEIIERYFNRTNDYHNYETSNPKVEKRVDAVNMKLCNMSGEIGIFVDIDNALPIIKDFEQMTRDESGKIEKEKLEKQGYNHNVENFGYMVWKEFPINEEIDEPLWMNAEAFI